MLQLWKSVQGAALLFAFAAVLTGGETAPGVRPSTYVLAPEDTVQVRVPDAEEFTLDKSTYRIDGDGFLNLPLIGRCRASGLTVSQLEAAITKDLKQHYLAPRVSVSITELHTEPVSMMGAVNTPGVQRFTGLETLPEALSRAGGLRADAGRSLTVTRRREYGRIPLPNAKDDVTGEFSTVTLSVAPIMSGDTSAANLVLKPHDVVTVSRAEMIYVLGEVTRTGGFVMNEKAELSVIKALALAGGMLRNAAPRHARIMRRSPETGQRIDIPVNLSRVIKRQAADVDLQPEDILYIPGDLTKKVATRTIEAAIGIGSNIAIWRSAQ